MPAAVFLIVGPAGTGKTHALIDRHRAVSTEAVGAGLWLVPTGRAADALRPRLLGRSAACLAPNLLTFPDFARRVVRAAQPAVRPLPELHQRLLLEEVLAELHAAGELPDFARVLDGRGLADALFGFLTELKGQGVSPDAFTRTARQVGAGGKDRQIGRIFARYQERLRQRRLLDREAAYALAAERLSAGELAPFAAVRAAFVDGFADFTPPQLALLEALAGRVRELWVTLPLDRADDDSRSELFSRPLETLARLQRLPADSTRLIRSDNVENDRPAGLTHLERQLFRPARQVEPSSDADGLHCIEAPGLVGEVRLAARAVKERLLAGVPADAIVLTARDLSPYADLLRETFAEYGVPLDLDGTDPLTRNPAVATLLRAARLAEDAWPFAGTTALLRSNFFRPAWPEVRRDPPVAEHAEALLRLLGEPRGRDNYLRSARLWSEEPPPGLEDEQAEAPRRLRKHQLAVRCRTFLERFFRAWDDAPERATLADHADWLRRFADDLGLSAVAAEAPADATALDRLWRELHAWAALEKRLHARTPLHSRAAFGRLLGTLAGSIGLPRTPGGPGRVRALPAEQARHVEADEVIVLGLGERGFPDLGGIDPLYDEAERQAFRQAGLDLGCAGDHLPDEMLLFYQIVTRPRRRLTLSYPAVDERGQPLLPSSFLEAVRACFAADAIPTTRQRMLIEGFDRQPPRSPAEYRVRWALEASHGRPSAGLPDELREQLRAAAAIARHRFHAKDFNAYDGRLTHPAVLADLSTRFGPDKVFSPTALERYVECPFRFYLEQVLRLEPLEDPREEVEHTRRGAAFHRALARLHAKLRDQQVHEPTPEVDEQLFAELDAAVEEYARRSSSPAAQMLWRLEGQRLRRSAGRYRAHWQKFQHPWRERSLSPRPHHLEVDFGLPADGGAEPVAPLVIIADGVEVRIGGRIDRVDVVELPDGGLGFWVIDYKTGKGLYYSASDLQSLRRLQLALYALAVERVLLADGSARPLGLAYWMVTEAGPKLVLPAGRQATAWLAAVDHWPRFRDRLEAWVAKLVGHVRAGEFPLKPRSEQCTETCPFGQVCRIAQSRSLEKLWDLPLPGEVLSPES